MKIIYFRHVKENGLFGPNSQDRAERILFAIFIALFSLVVFSQISLLVHNPASLAASKASLEGTPLGTEEYLYSAGSIELRLMSSEQDHNLTVLVNGEKAAAFDSRDVRLEVVDGDIIELDGSSTIESDVALCAISENLNRDNIGEIFTVDGNIKRVMKVKVQAE